MQLTAFKRNVFQKLQQDILSMQGLSKTDASDRVTSGLGPVEASFPGGVFPTGAVHEFVSPDAGEAAATNGFITGLLGAFMKSSGSCLWISTRRNVFPPALAAFGIAPERIIFVDLQREKEALWALEEALKCDSLAAVVGELSELGFTESRRLQLAVEHSRVTGFIHRHHPRSENTIAAVSRWRISPLSSVHTDGLPGLGQPRWNVQLLKVRNGRPGTWQIAWSTAGFQVLPAFAATINRRASVKTR